MGAALRRTDSRITTREFKDADAIWVNAKTCLDNEYLVIDSRMRKPRRVFARNPQDASLRVERFEREAGRRFTLPAQIVGIG